LNKTLWSATANYIICVGTLCWLGVDFRGDMTPSDSKHNAGLYVKLKPWNVCRWFAVGSDAIHFVKAELKLMFAEMLEYITSIIDW